MTVEEQARQARQASYRLATLEAQVKDRALEAAARALEEHRREILAENRKDQEEARRTGLKDSLLKRLILTEAKLAQMAESVREVVRLPDPVGRRLLSRELDEGLLLTKLSVPLGVIGVIFESRPDALVQIASLGMKSGNAVILKGGSEALHSNRILFSLLREAAAEVEPAFREGLQLVESRAAVRQLLVLDRLIDLLIPRGSGELVKSIQENTRIPVLGHAEGVCHLYVDAEADLGMAVELAYDAKCQYPAVCNAIETLLVHQGVAREFLPDLAARLSGVELRGDERTRAIIPALEASQQDWLTEYNDLILAVRVVDSLAEAIAHVNRYGSHHTDAIVTRDPEAARRFQAGVDSASVMWNCSTRFADGYRYGLGAEVGIATGKIHARGPVGLEGLTSSKYLLEGRGQAVADYVEGRRRFRHRDLP